MIKGRIEHSVVVADDHPIVREGMRALLDSQPDLSVAGVVGDGIEAVRLVEQLDPDVLVVDIMMPGLSGLEVTRQVHERHPNMHIVVLSMYDNEAYVAEALRHGAAAHVLKDAPADVVLDAVRAAAAGRRYLSPTLSERAIDAYVERAREKPPDRYENLTTREREVCHLAAEGLTSAEIGERLSISRRTVETHRANMMRKLQLASHTELVHFAIQRGIIPLES